MVAESEQKLEQGDIAPSFELMGTDENMHTLDEFSDKELVLVVFTCNHCPYAKAKIEELNHIAETYEDVAVIGINPNDASQKPEDSFERMQELMGDVEGAADSDGEEDAESSRATIRYDVYLRDEDQKVAKAYGAKCTPDPFLFANVGGSFELVYHGRLDDAMNPDEEPTQFYMREAIESLLEGEGVEHDFLPAMGCSIKWKDDQ